MKSLILLQKAGEILQYEKRQDQQGRAPFKESNPQHFTKGWAKIPIPKQIDDDEHIEKKCLRDCLGKVNGKSAGAPPRCGTN